MNIVDEMHAIAAALQQAGVAYAICGGLAVTIHGATRTTKDIDVLVDAADVPQVIAILKPLGYTVVALPMTFDAGTERERHVQRVSKLEGANLFTVDLLLAEAAFVGLLDDRIEVVTSRGPIQVVSIDALVRMKRLAGRSQDLADLERLGEDEA